MIYSIAALASAIVLIAAGLVWMARRVGNLEDRQGKLVEAVDSTSKSVKNVIRAGAMMADAGGDHSLRIAILERRLELMAEDEDLIVWAGTGGKPN